MPKPGGSEELFSARALVSHTVYLIAVAVVAVGNVIKNAELHLEM